MCECQIKRVNYDKYESNDLLIILCVCFVKLHSCLFAHWKEIVALLRSCEPHFYLSKVLGFIQNMTTQKLSGVDVF